MQAGEGGSVKIVQWAKYYPPEWGGMERVTYDLAAGWAAAGMESVVVAFTRAPAGGYEVTEGVRVHRYPLHLKFDTQPVSLGWIAQAFRQGRDADAVIAHAPNLLILFPLLALWLSGLFSRSRPQRILFWHSDIVGKGVFGWIARPIELLLVGISDDIIATSPPYARYSPILSRYAHKTTIIPLGIDAPATDAADGSPAISAHLSDFVRDRPLALSVGRLVPYKGFHILIEAFSRLPATNALVIVGEGPLREDLENAIAAAGAQDRILLVGSLAHRELAALYRRSDCFVMSSLQRSEAFGMVLLEAMSYGKPLVVCDIEGSGVPWVAGNDGAAEIVPVENVEKMAAAIRKILSGKDLAAEMGRSAQERFGRLFTKAQMLRGTTLLLTRNRGNG